MTTSPTQSHVRALDGLRGLAALYVVFFHCWQAAAFYGAPPDWLKLSLGWAAGGRLAVTAFIVLSGYLLSLPLSLTDDLRGGPGDFMRRRARRILPAYFVALAVSIVVVLALPCLYSRPHTYAAHTWPTNPWTDAVVRSVLLQDFSITGIYAYNGPMWSVAVEWHIYLAFAFVLVPVRRVRGPLSAIVLALAISAIVWWIAPQYRPSAFWMLGAFGIGMAAAEVSAGRWRRYFHLLPWGIVAATTGGLLIAFAVYLVATGRHSLLYAGFRMPILDLITSVAVAAVILVCARGDSFARRVLECRLPLWLGMVSYSLYLWHGPIVGAIDSVASFHGFSVPCRTVALLAVVPSSLAVAYASYRCIEHPFLRSRT